MLHFDDNSMKCLDFLIENYRITKDKYGKKENQYEIFASMKFKKL